MTSHRYRCSHHGSRRNWLSMPGGSSGFRDPVREMLREYWTCLVHALRIIHIHGSEVGSALESLAVQLYMFA